ncbi:MAG: hypothetical protein J5802_00745 [Butyrivibrio sp.]|nr:hypothetical protein [Butyrivibrio sp.]
MNKLMQDELLKIKDIDNTFDFTGKLSVINPEMYKVHDCVLMRFNDNPRVTEEEIEAAMRYKNFNYDYEHSEIRIGSYFEGITYEQSLRLALDIVEMWGYKLHALFPGDEFHIVMSVDIDSEYQNVVLNYYKYRGEENFHFDLDELDKYIYEAILVNVVEADEEYYEDDDEDDVDSDAIEADGET